MKRNVSLRVQLRLLGIVPALILLLLLLGLVTWQRFNDAAAELAGKGHFIAQHLATSSEYGVLSGNLEDLRQQAQLALLDAEVRYVLFTDVRGDVLLYQSAGDADIRQQQRALLTFSSRIYRQPVTVPDGGTAVTPAQVVTDTPLPIGEVVVGLSSESVSARQRQILLASLAPALAALLAAFWIAGRLAGTLSTPLAALSRLVRVIRAGGYHVRGTSSLGGELAELQTDINELASALERARREQDAAMNELRAAQQRAEAASDAKSGFLAMMSHELRTPLNGVLGMLQLMETTELSQEQREYASAAVESTNHLLNVINDILDFSRIESGRMDLELRFFPVAELIRNCVANFRYLAEQKGLALTLDGLDSVADLAVRSDSTRLRQVLGNLVSNAVKFTDRGSIHVQVGCEPVAGSDRVRLTLAVRDTGIGIPDDKLHGLFLAFSQLDSSTSRRYGGAGLGLAISRRLCAMLGGELTVSSRAGGGSTFVAEFVLDARRGGASVPLAAPERLQVLRGTVLLVEDNSINRMVTERMLRDSGVTVISAENGEQALVRLASAQVDCILMDVQMPVLDGLEATRRLRAWEQDQQRTRLPVVALTANALAGERERCLEAGMDDYLSKPFLRRQLLEVVGRYLPSAEA